jgi:hypothetical protein
MKNPRKGIVREGRYKNRSHKNKEFQRERTKKRRERERVLSINQASQK